MKLETLYKRTRTGAIQYWEVSTEDRAWDIEGKLAGVIRSESGQLGTDKPVTHVSYAYPKNVGKKNETSPTEQAELDAASDWRKKKDDGYKTLADLGVDENTPPGEFEQVLDKALPQFNTDANGNVKPMLAHPVKEGYKGVYLPCLAQPKMDGVRSLMVVKDGDVTFLSRKGKLYTTLDHIARDVKNFLKTFASTIIEKDFILDGEIYSDELTFSDISRAVKKQSPDSLKLKFRAYDVVNNRPQEQRLNEVSYITRKIASPNIIMTQTVIITLVSQIKAYHDKWVSEGYEGLMLRLPNGFYAQGQRSHDLLKVKEFDETEFLIHHFETGEREEDLLAVFELPIGYTGMLKDYWRAKMVGSRAIKAQLVLTYGLNKPVKDTQVTIKHFGWTDDGLPRFPIGKAVRDYE